jgi:hypothetical protein
MPDPIACKKFKRLADAFLDGNAILLDCVDEEGRSVPAVCSVNVYDHDEYGEVREMMPLAFVLDSRGWLLPEEGDVFPYAHA